MNILKKLMLIIGILIPVVSTATTIDSNRFAPGITDTILKKITSSPFIKRIIYPDEEAQLHLCNAPDFYTALFVQAADDFGTEKCEQLPIKIFETKDHECLHISPDSSSEALVTSKAICINKKMLNRAPYGHVKHTAHHENCHIYYKDITIRSFLENNSTTAIILFILSLLSLVCACLMLIFKRKTILFILPMILFIAGLYTDKHGCQLDTCINNWYKNYTEQRADLEALKKADCYECAKEARYMCYTASEERERARGYISSDRRKEFIKKYKAEGKCCCMHKNIKERTEITIEKPDGTIKKARVLMMSQIK